MRITSVTIGKFKNLRGLTVDFSSPSQIDVIVGKNGTGKSNFLEALSIIFRDLDLGEAPLFEYSITYECRGALVTIVADPEGRPSRDIWVDGAKRSLGYLRREGSDRLLPDFVFGYYSGPTDRLSVHFERHQNAFNKALREGLERPLRRLFYAQPVHSQFVLLAFFLDTEESARSFLSEYLRIQELDSVLFVLREPSWKSRQGDPRFWNARGVVAALLDQIHSLALAPMRLKLDRSLGRRTRQRPEHVYLYLRDMSAINELARAYGSDPQALFTAFESILAADLLAEVRVRVRARGVDDSLIFRELSEGEQQLLMVLGLLRFTRGDESLFLLDEPDTHLNPAWSVNYTGLLAASSGSTGASSHVLMTTHDPLVIASLTRDQVTIFTRSSDTGAASVTRPERDPRGMGVSSLLTSDIYGLPSELDPDTFRKLQRRRWLAAGDDLTEEELSELHALTQDLGNLSFTFATRDPLFRRFERAVLALEPESDVTMTPQEVRQQERNDEDLLSSVLPEPADRAIPEI